MASLLLLNGPNLNLLGTRQPEIYGAQTLADVERLATTHAEAHGHSLTCAQSNSEGALVDHLHAARGVHAGVVFNAGARHGIKPGLRYSVVRDGQTVARVRTTDVREDISGAVIEQVEEDRYPEQGDRLILRDVDLSLVDALGLRAWYRDA